LYKVEYFVKNKDTLPPLTTDTTRWSKLIVSRYEGYAQVNYMNDSVKYFSIKPDTLKHEISFNTMADTIHKFNFSYVIQKPGGLVLNGKWKQDSLHIRLRRYSEKEFPLLKWPLHNKSCQPKNISTNPLMFFGFMIFFWL